MKKMEPLELYRGMRTGEIIWPRWTEDGMWYRVTAARLVRNSRNRKMLVVTECTPIARGHEITPFLVYRGPGGSTMWMPGAADPVLVELDPLGLAGGEPPAVLWPEDTRDGWWYSVDSAVMRADGKHKHLVIGHCCEEDDGPPPPPPEQYAPTILDRSPYQEPTGHERPMGADDTEPRHTLCSYFSTPESVRAGRLGWTAWDVPF
jgi:hypothetical protein